MAKRLIMTSVNGVDKYACRKCGAVMEPRDNYSMQMCAGDILESGGEFLQCTNPDCMITTPYPKMHVRDFKTFEARF